MSESIDQIEARFQRAATRFGKVVGGDFCKFERAVKFITREKRLDRAMPWFRRWLKGACDFNEDDVRKALTQYRKDGIPAIKVDLWRGNFRNWKREEKSRSAKKSAGVRKR